MIKAVILDFDDTLCLTKEASFILANEALAKMGRPPIDPKVHNETWGMVLTESMPLRSPGINYGEFKPIFDQTLHEHATSGKWDLIPAENLKVLEEILAQGKRVAILTSRTFGEVKHLLDGKHPLSRLVNDFYHRDNNDYLKPDPKVFDKFLAKNNLKPSECVYVGNSLSDAKATLGAGMHFIASLESELRSKEDFEKLGVKNFITEFPQLLEMIKFIDHK